MAAVQNLVKAKKTPIPRAIAILDLNATTVHIELLSRKTVFNREDRRNLFLLYFFFLSPDDQMGIGVEMTHRGVIRASFCGPLTYGSGHLGSVGCSFTIFSLFFFVSICILPSELRWYRVYAPRKSVNGSIRMLGM